MAYTQKINSRDENNPTSFKNAGFVPVNKDKRTNVTTYKNPLGEVRYGVPGKKGTVKVLKKEGKPYTGKK